MLAFGAGVAIYRITSLRERSLNRTPELIERERVAYLSRLASNGSISAQVDLAAAYADGVGVARDAASAAHWNHAAADQGDPSAQIRLARAYSYGDGTDRNFAQAANWLKKAAEQGNADAQCAYGIYRFQGLGTEKDVVDGFMWLNRAADAGSDYAAAAVKSARRQMSPEQLAAGKKTNTSN